MGFPNVDHEELDAITVLGIQIMEAHGPSYKGRSSKTAEYQRNGHFPAEVGKPNRIYTAYIPKLEIGCQFAFLGCLNTVPSMPPDALSPAPNCVTHLDKIPLA